MTAAKPLLRQNAELKKDHVFNWSLPAWVTTFEDGTSFNVCPQAGACAKVCYAMNGTYRFPAVKAAHQRNLLLTQDGTFMADMITELRGKKFRPKNEPRVVAGLDSIEHLSPRVQELLNSGAAAVRVHDGGDFYSDEYLADWAPGLPSRLANPVSGFSSPHVRHSFTSSGISRTVQVSS